MNPEIKYVAHVRKDENSGQWIEHDLGDHLKQTAQLASEFAQSFGSGDWAYLAGVGYKNLNGGWQNAESI